MWRCVCTSFSAGTRKWHKYASGGRAINLPAALLNKERGNYGYSQATGLDGEYDLQGKSNNAKQPDLAFNDVECS